MSIQKPKGTFDILPEEAGKRQHIYTTLREVFSLFNYSEILTPAFEKTELFKRSIGEQTDIVSKEMYSFNEDKFTLRPEMTASVIRAYLENSLYNESPLKKLFYICNMFRRERPQAGRYREFWQFGVEAIGSEDVTIDAEVIAIANMILNRFGVTKVSTKVNTIGTSEERQAYILDLKDYLQNHIDELTEESKIRLEKNPLRILDTKNEAEKKILEKAPVLYDSLTEPTKNKFERLLNLLEKLNIKYEIDHKLVRGLDYYTHTTFEVLSGDLGAQNAVLGGGRYDLLVSQLGGKPTPAIGFASGIERLLMLMDGNKYPFPAEAALKLFVVAAGEKAAEFSSKLVNDLRLMGIKTETDYLGRSIKSQMREANKANAEYVIVAGDNEMASGKAMLKTMSDGTEREIDLNSPEKIKELIS